MLFADTRTDKREASEALRVQNIRQHLLRHLLKKVLELLYCARAGSTPDSVCYLTSCILSALLTSPLVLALLDTSKPSGVTLLINVFQEIKKRLPSFFQGRIVLELAFFPG